MSYTCPCRGSHGEHKWSIDFPDAGFNRTTAFTSTMLRQSARVVILGGFVLCGIALVGHSLLKYIPGGPLLSASILQSPFKGEEFSWETVKSSCFDFGTRF